MDIDYRFIKKETLDKIANSIRGILGNNDKVNIEDVSDILEAHYNEPIKIIVEADNFADSQSELVLNEKRLKGVSKIGDYALSGWHWLKALILPDTVVSIGNHSCENTSNLEVVQTGNAVESIGDSAFKNCKNLNDLTIGNNVKSIGDEAFYGCESLENIYNYESIKSIGNKAFENCISLQSAKLQGLEVAGEESFKGCFSLEVVNLGNVSEISKSAFEGCTNLKSVAISSEEYSIGDGAFKDCIKLSTNAFDSILNRATEIGTDAFNNATSLDWLSIPNTITRIGERAFANNSNINLINVGSSNTSEENKLDFIGKDAFTGCHSSLFIYFWCVGTVPQLENTADSIFPPTCRIFVPYSMYDAWISTEYWCDISDRISIITSTKPTEDGGSDA